MCLCARDSEPFDVSGLSLFLQDNSSCLLPPRVRKHSTQISPPPCRMQWWATCPNIQDLWGVKYLACSTADHFCQIFARMASGTEIVAFLYLINNSETVSPWSEVKSEGAWIPTQVFVVAD